MLTGAIADPSVDVERSRAGWGIGWRWRRCGLARDGPYRGAFRRNIYDVIVILYTTYTTYTKDYLL